MDRGDVRPGLAWPATVVVDIVAAEGKDRMDIGRLYGDTYGFLGHPGLEALRTAQDRGADAIELNVLPANEGAQAFWQRRGFRLNTLGFRRDLDAHHA